MISFRKRHQFPWCTVKNVSSSRQHTFEYFGRNTSTIARFAKKKKGKWYRKLESELENRRIEEEEQIKNESIGTPIC